MPAETDPNPAALTDEQAAAEARRIIADFATSYRNTDPVPTRGDAPPVPQPGRPPMSQKATDVSALMLSGGVASVLAGGSVSLVLAASGIADPTVIGLVCAAPVAVAVPIWAAARFVKRWKQAAPVTVNNYSGPVYKQTTHTENRGVWAKTTNRK